MYVHTHMYTPLTYHVYLIIKELEPSEQEVFICMSCLIKDATTHLYNISCYSVLQYMCYFTLIIVYYIMIQYVILYYLIVYYGID